MEFLRKYWHKAVHLGLPLPHAYDPVEKLPSFRLLAAYVSFFAALVSTAYLHFDATAVAGTLAAISMYVLSMTFYLIKKLSGAKIDLSAKKFELSNNDVANSMPKE